MERKAWFCPSCQKHHAPHCDTCPGVAGALPGPAPVVPGITPDEPPREWHPGPTSDPWVPYWPQVICGGVSFPVDPNAIIMNGPSYSVGRALQ